MPWWCRQCCSQHLQLGGHARLVTCVGVDSEANRLRALLASLGVAVDAVEDLARPTTVKTRFASGQQQLLRLDGKETAPLSSAIEEQAIDRQCIAIEDCALLVISDYAKGMLTDRVLREAMTLCASHRIPVFVDPKRSDFSMYRGAALIKSNRGELQRAAGLSVQTELEVEKATAAVAAGVGVAILVTRSEAGMLLVRNHGEAIHIPALAREVYDVTGAGDSVMAALAVGVASDLSMEEAVAFANLAGSVAVSRHGTALVTAAELEAERDLIGTEPARERGACLPFDEAVRLRALWKRQGLVIGFTNGCFDLLHPGHIALLAAAAAACDRLVVGLNSDASVRRLKGAGRPVQAAAARAAVLGALRHVDLVVTFDGETPAALIEGLLPDVLVKGADYATDAIVGADTVRAAGGRVFAVDRVPGQYTTRLIAAGRRSEAVE